MVQDTITTSGGRSRSDLGELGTSLVYIINFKLAGTAQRDFVSKTFVLAWSKKKHMNTHP